MNKYKITYIADGCRMEDVWCAESESDAVVVALDTYQVDYRRVKIVRVEQVKG